MCRAPRFWFFKEYFYGPPTMSCTTSIKYELDEVKGALGYMVTIISALILLILFTVCGICKSKDFSFQQQRSEQAIEQKDIEMQNAKEQSFDNIANENSSTVLHNDGAGNQSKLEMPDRAKRFQIRQRNFDVE
jgi:hypothetical protein